ncbi:MAG: hypothetical protein RL701_4184 [Pseudomonadota bacterium]
MRGGLAVRALVAVCVLNGCSKASTPQTSAVGGTSGRHTGGAAAGVDAAAPPCVASERLTAGNASSAVCDTGGTAASSGAGAAAVRSGSGGSGSAGRAGVGDGGISGQAPAAACKIPNDIVILAEDADGGVLAPGCQNVPRKLITENCIGLICHDLSGPPAGGIELMGPCVADRLVNIKSRCQDLLYINTAEPTRSFLTDKLNSSKPACGESMPQGGHLPPDELACMNAWVKAVIRTANAAH